MRFRLLPVSLALAAAVAVPGCGERFEFADVEGTVTLGGKPLEKIRVEFSPLTDGPQSTALTNAQGRFSLATVDGTRKGAVLGKHKVVLRDVSIYKVPFAGRINENIDMTGGEKPRIAANYANVMMTPLEFEVAGSTKDAAFDVKPYAPLPAARVADR